MSSQNGRAETPETPAQIGVGVVAPFDFALDREMWRWAPDDVSLHLTRTPFVPHPVGIELAVEVAVDDHIREATRSLVAVEPGVVVYACTSGSFVQGRTGERRLRAVLDEGGARAAVTTSGALLDALELLGVQRLALATPYVREVNDRLEAFLGEAGVEAVSSECLGLEGRIWEVGYPITRALIEQADRAEADAIFVSCTNLLTFDLIALLEAQLGKPVLTANQVTMWGALRAIGRQIRGPGQRLADEPTPELALA